MESYDFDTIVKEHEHIDWSVFDSWQGQQSGDKYIKVNDPGHGWLEVSKSELTRLRIGEKISAYSFQRGNKVYLEEDLDMSTFIAARILSNKPFHIVSTHMEDCPIRKYRPYTG